MRRLAEEDAGGVGERGGDAGVKPMQVAKALDLGGVERVIGDLGAREMAHQQHDAVIFMLEPRRERRHFHFRHAQPVHAGVDVERRAALPFAGSDKGVPFRQLRDAVDDRPRIDLDERRRGVGREAVEHIDRGLARAGAHAARLGDIGHEKRLAARRGELGGDGIDAEPIGVGLDHRRAFHRHELLRQRPPIGLDCREIDGKRPAGLRIGQRGCQFGNYFCEGHTRVMTGATASR